MDEVLFEHFTETKEITLEEALRFIHDKNNSVKARNKIEDLKNRYISAKSKNPKANFIMVVSRLGKCSLWLD